MPEIRTDVKLSDIIIQIENGDTELDAVWPRWRTGGVNTPFLLFFRMPSAYNKKEDLDWVHIRVWPVRFGHEGYLHDPKVAIKIIKDVPLSKFYDALRELYTLSIMQGGLDGLRAYTT
jgi:hypothetical protein